MIGVGVVGVGVAVVAGCNQSVRMWLLVVVAFLTHQAAACTRWHNCGNCSGQGEGHEVALLAFLGDEHSAPSHAYRKAAEKGAGLLRRHGRIEYDDDWILHTTVMYLCCLDDHTFYSKVVPAIESVPWQPFNVSFDVLHCNFDNSTNRPTATTTSLIVLLSPDTQRVMGAMVDRFEQAIRGAGVPVAPRSGMEPFHSTLAVVPHRYPVAAGLAAVNGAISGGQWTGGKGPIEVRSFESVLPPWRFHSK